MKILHDFFHLFFPRLCYLCNRPLVENEKVLCLNCLADLPHYAPDSEKQIEQLKLLNRTVESFEIFLKYDKGGKVRELIHGLKYHGQKELGLYLGEMAARHLMQQKSPICQADFLIPVPLHHRKKRERGYNQSEIICQSLSKHLNIPIDTKNLKRRLYTETQTKKDIQNRWSNVESKFKVENDELWNGKRIILVDDVLTTGATLTSCAQSIIQKSKPKSIGIFALCGV